jgi:hypothetical protein
VAPEAQAAGLHDGDVVLAIAAGRPFEGLADYSAPIRLARAGDRLLIRVRSGAVEKDLSVPLVSLALGFWVAAVRVRDRAAWHLPVLMLAFACLISADTFVAGAPQHDDMTLVVVRAT